MIVRGFRKKKKGNYSAYPNESIDIDFDELDEFEN